MKFASATSIDVERNVLNLRYILINRREAVFFDNLSKILLINYNSILLDFFFIDS